MKWAYGITTVPKRIKSGMFGNTLTSLKETGFDTPHIFIDGAATDMDLHWSNLPITARYPAVRVAANWLLSMWELYLRNPLMDRYAIFQDDIIACCNLKEYLERIPYPKDGYLNLYTSPCNERAIANPYPASSGFLLSRYCRNRKYQSGKGALALVFSRQALITLLKSPFMVTRFSNPNVAWKNVDGGIVQAMNDSGWKEYIHNPSLVQHTGMTCSTFAMGKRLSAISFREKFNALDLLCYNREQPIPP